METGIEPMGFISIGLEGLLYLALAFFVLFTLALTYHWFSYGTDRKTAAGALVIYLGVSAIILITAAMALLAIK